MASHYLCSPLPPPPPPPLLCPTFLSLKDDLIKFPCWNSSRWNDFWELDQVSSQEATPLASYSGGCLCVPCTTQRTSRWGHAIRCLEIPGFPPPICLFFPGCHFKMPSQMEMAEHLCVYWWEVFFPKNCLESPQALLIKARERRIEYTLLKTSSLKTMFHEIDMFPNAQLFGVISSQTEN